MIVGFYKLFDYIAYFLIKIFVDVGNVREVLKMEIEKNSNDALIENTEFYKQPNLMFVSHIEVIQTRASTLISHISIMIAILMFSLSAYSKSSWQFDIILIELIIYLCVTVANLRCLRAYGFEQPHNKKTYNKVSLDDLVLRFCIYRLSNFIVMLLTIVFIALVIYEPPFQFHLNAM